LRVWAMQPSLEAIGRLSGQGIGIVCAQPSDNESDRLLSTSLS
jgi:hypothetical protein